MAAIVVQLVEHRMHFSKVTGSVSASDKLSFRTLYFLCIYILTASNNSSYIFLCFLVF